MTHRWGPEIEPALDPGFRGTLRVTGGPGTGKSSLLMDAAAAHIAAGADPQTVLFLTGSGRLGTAARSALTRALLAACANRGRALPTVIAEPVVRTVHGLAFAVLRRAAQRAGNPPPRLVTSAEQDAIIRELLVGLGADAWPDPLSAAVATDGFGTELRNLLARCAERGVDPRQLVKLGRRYRRPEWIAAARFAYQYEEVMLLRAAVGMAAPQATVPALGAAELVGAALDALAADPELLAAERSRVRVLLVDDAQQLDPQAARLVRVLADGAQVSVIGYDSDQAVFGFRGGGPGVLCDPDTWSSRAADSSVRLRASLRCSPSVAQAINGIAGRLPGPRGAGLDGCAGHAGSVTVRSAGSCHAEAALIADALRRAHLLDGVPWSQMAVLVRSAPRAAGRLPRTLAAAGIPVTLPATGEPLAQHPAVAALLTVLTAASDGLDEQRALMLLSGPIGRVDPVSLRQLRRLLRNAGNHHSGEVLTAALTGAPGLPTGHTRPLRRLRAVLQAASEAQLAGRDPNYTLWQAWHRSGLQQRWLKLRERGGPAGVQADRDLDAVTALFDIAAQYVAQTAGASLRGLVDHVTTMQLAPRAEPVAGVEAVSVLSVHAALGHEWDLVVIAGLQEGLWPNTVPRGGVLHTQRLLDVLDGVDEQASTRAPLLAEERRLLVAAIGRARRHLLVTAVDGDGGGDAAEDEIPSGFFAELTRWDTSGGQQDCAAPVAAPQVLSAPAVVGRLRCVVCAPAGAVDAVQRRSAATQLARLAQAGVPGADPAGWHGLAPVSTDEPLWHRDDGSATTLSPSSMQTLIDCPLRWLIERHGGTGERDLRSTIGSVIHALIAEPGTGDADLLAKLERLWPQLPFDSPWYAANELDRHRALLTGFLRWRDHSRAELTEAGTEVDVDGMIGGVRLRGRIDRIERDAAGRVVIVDVKTSKTPVSKDDAQQHAQLALYQLAVDAGLLAEGDEPGGGRLVYPAKPTAAGAIERVQDALTPDGREHWRHLIAEAAAATTGPTFAARVNDGCRHCPVRPICPAHQQGAV